MKAARLVPLTLGLFGLIALVAAGFVAGCSEASCDDTGTCAASGGGANTADAGDPVYPEIPPPPGCDVQADGKSAPECLVDDYALFVDGQNGSNANPGTKAAPLRTIGAAATVDKLRGRPRVYVCGEGPYREGVKLPANVSLFGGAVCGSWTFALSPVKTKIEPEAPGYALHIDGSAKGVVVSDLAVASLPASEPGGSSIAMFINASKIILRRIDGAAGAGKSARDADSIDNMFASSLAGNPATSSGGDIKTCKCPAYGESAGGKGGDLGQPGSGGSSVPAGVASGLNDGSGADATCSGVGARGGTQGTARSGGSGATTPGELTAAGWQAAAGTDGEAGNPGGGGGGGGGKSAAAPSGSCGGCGGGGGRGGKGGGSSFVLALRDSDAKVEACAFVSAPGGSGGRGGNGQSGQAGGPRGTGSCAGAEGGHGAGGGGGGAGAPGNSAGIARRGGSLTLDEATTLKFAAAGTGNLGGEAGKKVQSTTGSSEDGKPGTASSPLGLAQPILELE